LRLRRLKLSLKTILLKPCNDDATLLNTNVMYTFSSHDLLNISGLAAILIFSISQNLV